jgi:hypothetical protein
MNVALLLAFLLCFTIADYHYIMAWYHSPGTHILRSPWRQRERYTEAGRSHLRHAAGWLGAAGAAWLAWAVAVWAGAV